MKPNYFSNQLIEWHHQNPRHMPWKETSDPYLIWISEIILQQTRVAQGWEYYLNFIKKFPTVYTLSSSSLEEVLKSWEGLGYYTRARNLHKASKIIVQQYKGIFPSNYKEIIALPGIGPYTAAAISSFAFGLSYPVIDGNVKRVVSRCLGITEEYSSKAFHNKVLEFTTVAIKKSDPAVFNQSIMNFGAIQCTPKSPGCETCPFSKTCIAYREDLVSSIPLKLKKIKRRNRYFHYFIIKDIGGNMLVCQRDKKDIWQGLFEFPLVEGIEESMDLSGISNKIGLLKEKLELNQIIRDNQLLTHQKIFAYFYICTYNGHFINNEEDHYTNLTSKDVYQLAFPRIIRKVINKLNSKNSDYD